MPSDVISLTPRAIPTIRSQQRAVLQSADRSMRRGHYAESLALADAVVSVSDAINDADLRAEAIFWRARTLLSLGETERAQRDFDEASSFYITQQDHERIERARAMRFFVAIDTGDFLGAKAIAPVVDLRSGRLTAALVRGYHGNLHRALGELKPARRAYLEAVAMLDDDDRDNVMFKQVFKMDRAITDLLDARPAEALGKLSQVRQAVINQGTPSALLMTLVAHYQYLARALMGDAQAPRLQLEAIGTPERMELLESLHALLHDGARGRVSRKQRDDFARAGDAAATWDHGRLSLAIVDRLLERKSSKRAVLLLVSPSAEIEPAEEQRVVVDLRKRPPLARIATCLAEAHARSDASPHPASKLIAVAWGEERMVADSARNRLHVAISTLRTMGLSDALVRTRAGYLLDPSVEVQLR